MGGVFKCTGQYGPGPWGAECAYANPVLMLPGGIGRTRDGPGGTVYLQAGVCSESRFLKLEHMVSLMGLPCDTVTEL